MSIAVVCSKCSAKLNAPDSTAGKRVKCPKCQNTLLVPEALAPEFEVVDEPQPARKPAIKPKAVAKAAVELDDDDEQPRKKWRGNHDEDDEDDDDRPKKKKKKGAAAGNGSMTRNIVGGVLLVVLLGVAGYVFYDRFKKKDDEPASSSSSNANKSDVPTGTIPILPGGPGAAGTGGPPPKGTGGPKGNPIGGKKPIGTPGQPITVNSPAGFKITFPGPYVRDELPPPIRNKVGLPGTIYLSQEGTRQNFVAAHADFDPNATAADKKSAYDKVVSFVLEEGLKGGQPSRRMVMAGGRSWEEITITEASEGGIFRLLQTDTRVILIAVVNERAVPSADIVKKFFDTFELTK